VTYPYNPLMVTRRSFLNTVGLASLGTLSARAMPLAANPVRVDGAQLRQRIEALSMFGRPAGGSFGDGVSRVAYSEADIAGRAYFTGQMKAAGLVPRIDAAGNIFATRPGTDPSLKPILFGSHIDSVPNGGNFDGDLGSLSALGVMEALERASVRTRHPLEMVVWAHEEGVAFGRGLACSRIVAGDFKPADLDETWNGMWRADAIRKIGGDPDRLPEASRSKGSIHTYLELHIEQGGTLEKAQVPVGVVEGIVAIDKYDVTVTGFANHAGTTPMPDRQDAMLAAAHLTVAVREIVTSEPGRQVGTVGHLEISPNAPNVIPGSAKLTIELRDLSSDKLRRLGDAVQARAREIAVATRTTIDFRLLELSQPAAAEAHVQNAIERAASGLTLKTMRLPSGAGHDAQMMAQLGPMGMMFVPSIGGISHSPKELTRWEDCANGANVLLHTILEVDKG
jgi:beta-ureidopropionase / N-carbamoyl-L-amino-acid hydrolase